MTGPIVDPDLERAIEELRFTALRLEQVERQLVDYDRADFYRHEAARRAERNDLREAIKLRAETLNMQPRALLLILDQANRMRSAKLRKPPSLAALAGAVSTISAATERDRLEVEADLVVLRVRENTVMHRAKAAADALKYLEACR